MAASTGRDSSALGSVVAHTGSGLSTCLVWHLETNLSLGVAASFFPVLLWVWLCYLKKEIMQPMVKSLISSCVLKIDWKRQRGMGKQ